EMFGGLHPSPFGNRVYARGIVRLFDTVWGADTDLKAAPVSHAPLPSPIDPLNYEHGHYVELSEAHLKSGWEIVESWESTDDTSTRKRFIHIPTLEALEPDAELELAFTGTAVGLLMTVGPDVGVLEYAIDGGEAKRVDPFTEWSDRLHIPWALMLETELEPGPHRLVLRTTEGKNDRSVGNAQRIVRFLVNGPRGPQAD
ncbi:MAG: SGNH/GDSL hydrolase family protein, partial [Candidatus Omnitrophica bacterium]|nr:SGNH/GDSL hydrolase family protein [Candidatus Omnitrophota bacterium]